MKPKVIMMDLWDDIQPSINKKTLDLKSKFDYPKNASTLMPNTTTSNIEMNRHLKQ
jgi:hypothetical protein